MRTQLLHEQLEKLGIDADDLLRASRSALEDPTSGYDVNYGKSAIRCYRSFVSVKPSDLDFAGDGDELSNRNSFSQLSAAAGRCARQVDFLIKRHKSHQTEWVRHHDASIKARTKVFPLIVLLDNVRSSFNVGSIFRTADACGCQKVITTGISPHPNGNGADKLSKSSLGAEQVVPSQHFGSTKEAIAFLRNELPNFELVGMETTEHSQVYTDVKYPSCEKGGVVLVLGNEVTGVDTDILPQLDRIVEIPMFGIKNSLNVAACAPVLLYEIIRQWQT